MSRGRFLGSLLSGVALVVAFLASCVSAGFNGEPEPSLRPAWAMYRKGNFQEAKATAVRLLETRKTENPGRYLLCLIAHQEGRYDEAIRQYSRIRRSYPKRKLLASPVAWSYIFLGDYGGALNHLENAGVRLDPALLGALADWKDAPLKTEASGVVEIPFTDDGLSPFMPGFKVKINGKETVARLDTGGGFIHLTQAWAERLGVRSTVREKGFASLQEIDIGYGGFVDLELGTFILRNVPVYVMDHLEAQSVAMVEVFGEGLGPIIGTNVLQRFISTIDGPGRRIILSPRADPAATATHATLLAGDAAEFPFTMWDDHFMLARGALGGKPINLFFDSGLVVFTPEQEQAALLASIPFLESWGATIPEQGRFAEVPLPLAVGGFGEGNPLAVPVPEATWKAMGDWGGVDVDALISWGFLKEYAWTIDFDRMTYAFRKPGDKR